MLWIILLLNVLTQLCDLYFGLLCVQVTEKLTVLLEAIIKCPHV